MTFEDLRITYQCPERMARDLHAQLELAQAMYNREHRLRIEAEKKLAPPVARRTYRGEN